MIKGIEFRLVKSYGNFYWTVLLPTQIKREKTFEEAEKNLSLIVRKLLNRKFKVGVFDLTTGKETDYFGGILKLLAKAKHADDGRANSATSPKRIQKRKKKRSPVVSRASKRRRR